MATKYSPNEHDIAEINREKADVFLDGEWLTMVQGDRDTWLANTQFNTLSKIKDKTGKKMFLHYFGQSFGAGTNSNVVMFLSVTLGVGTDDTFINRSGRTWGTT
ncbi:MAG: hypothetical protein IEMM0008_1638 [bacterium]|nr:MAG: hypothetical protein IEMM0008_1638 [bacterium]